MKKYARLLRLFLICAAPIVVATYSIWYWSSSHEELAVWYKSIHPVFYKAEQWEAIFFTEAVKISGNYWCFAALLAAVVWTYLIWKTPAPINPGRVPNPAGVVRNRAFKKQDAVACCIIVSAGIVLSWLASEKAFYATDEVFSALNFAARPAFQTFSHYPLPNNHILYNAINGALFFWSSDLVLTGRFISLVCYVALLCFTWHFLKKQVEARWLRGLILLVLAVQLPVWGFSGQARGYELVLLCSSLSFITFYSYFTTKARYLLPLHTACNVAGLLTVPTYLYWWCGLLLAAFILQLAERRLDWPWLRTSITGFAASLILWLPLLTFSGLAVLTENRYVKAEDTTALHFLSHLNQNRYFNGLFKEWFGTNSSSPLIGLVCLLLPVLLFIYPKKNSQRRVLGIIFYSIWIAFLGMAVFMLKLPFYRNLIAHGYLSLLVLLIAVLPLFRLKVMRIISGLMLLAFAGFSAYRNYNRIPDHLFYYNIGTYFQELSQVKTEFKHSGTVYLDNECFYWWYVLRKKYPEQKLVIELNRPCFNLQDYCVMPLDSLPPAAAALYRLVEMGSEHQIFEKQNK